MGFDVADEPGERLWPERRSKPSTRHPSKLRRRMAGFADRARGSEEAVSPFEVERLRGKLAANEAPTNTCGGKRMECGIAGRTDLSDEASAEHSDLTAQTFSLSASDDSFPAMKQRPTKRRTP